VTADVDAGIDLKAVQDVVVMSRDQNMDQFDADAGHPTWSAKVNPPVWVVEVRRKTGPNAFYFREEQMANRVAKAITHAVELCGGGKEEEPF
jgi:hypothetical protein